MKPKYVIAPGYVISKTDGQRHYIGAMELIRLYGVDPRQCRIYEPAPYWTRSHWQNEEIANQGLIWLAPRFDGNYSLTSTVSVP